MSETMRTEQDSIGSLQLPADALYGVHTARAMQNFSVTGVSIAHFPELINALATVKMAAAQANAELGVLDPLLAHVIVDVCTELREGLHHQHFVVDVIQGGAGTSTNMNANEVIANLGLLRLGFKPGQYGHLHPNDHVNLSQSTNDVYPTAIRLAILSQIAPLQAELWALQSAFDERAAAFHDVLKVGRTQLQDAVPMSLGMEFAGFAVTVGEDIERLSQLGELLKEVNLGGTAIGTGVNTPKGYGPLVIAKLSGAFGQKLVRSSHLIEASSDLGAFVTFSGVLKRISVKLSKICNDLRLLSSGPRAGLGEIRLPAVQAGSSIMPGKVNPVIPEMVNQVAYQVIGNDMTVTMAAEAGQLQLNAMEPIAAYNILQSMRLLGRAVNILTERCVTGIEANVEHCRRQLDGSLVLATALAPYIGYERSSAIAKLAERNGLSILEATRQAGLTDEDALSAIADPVRMIQGGAS